MHLFILLALCVPTLGLYTFDEDICEGVDPRNNTEPANYVDPEGKPYFVRKIPMESFMHLVGPGDLDQPTILSIHDLLDGNVNVTGDVLINGEVGSDYDKNVIDAVNYFAGFKRRAFRCENSTDPDFGWHTPNNKCSYIGYTLSSGKVTSKGIRCTGEGNYNVAHNLTFLDRTREEIRGITSCVLGAKVFVGGNSSARFAEFVKGSNVPKVTSMNSTRQKLHLSDRLYNRYSIPMEMRFRKYPVGPYYRTFMRFKRSLMWLSNTNSHAERCLVGAIGRTFTRSLNFYSYYLSHGITYAYFTSESAKATSGWAAWKLVGDYWKMWVSAGRYSGKYHTLPDGCRWDKGENCIKFDVSVEVAYKCLQLKYKRAIPLETVPDADAAHKSLTDEINKDRIHERLDAKTLDGNLYAFKNEVAKWMNNVQPSVYMLHLFNALVFRMNGIEDTVNRVRTYATLDNLEERSFRNFRTEDAMLNSILAWPGAFEIINKFGSKCVKGVGKYLNKIKDFVFNRTAMNYTFTWPNTFAPTLKIVTAPTGGGVSNKDFREDVCKSFGLMTKCIYLLYVGIGLFVIMIAVLTFLVVKTLRRKKSLLNNFIRPL